MKARHALVCLALAWPHLLRAQAPRRQGCLSALQPADSVYGEAKALSDTLLHRGVRVVCTYHITLDGLVRNSLAAGFRTNRGSFSAYFVRTPNGAADVHFTETARRSQAECGSCGDTTVYSYSLESSAGPGATWESQYRSYFIAHGNVAILLYDERLAARLKRALDRT
jgi:hypothetical protein